MSEQGDFDIMTGGAVKEGSDVSDEVFGEQMAQTQAALKQLWKEESKARAQDDQLSQILIQFLSQPQNTDLFLLMSRVIAQNIPSEFILAMVALIDATAGHHIAGLLEGAEAPSETLPPVTQVGMDEISETQKQVIDSWIQVLHAVASKTPQRMVETMLVRRPTPGISPSLIQLGAFVVRRYLSARVSIEFETLYAFMQTVFLKLFESLESQVKNQKQLKGND